MHYYTNIKPCTNSNKTRTRHVFCQFDKKSNENTDKFDDKQKTDVDKKLSQAC